MARRPRCGVSSHVGGPLRPLPSRRRLRALLRTKVEGVSRPQVRNVLRQRLAVLLWRTPTGVPSGSHHTKDDHTTCSTVHREVIDWAGRKLVLETGKHRPPGRRRRARHLRRDDRARHRRRRQGAEARAGFLSAHRQLPGKGLRGRPHPRRLFQARGAPVGEGDAGLPPDRPPDPPAVPGGLPQRHPGRRHRAGA